MTLRAMGGMALILAFVLGVSGCTTRGPIRTETPLGSIEMGLAPKAPQPEGDEWSRLERRWMLTQAGLAQGWSLVDLKGLPEADPILAQAVKRRAIQRLGEGALHLATGGLPGLGLVPALLGVKHDLTLSQALQEANIRNGSPEFVGALPALTELSQYAQFESAKTKVMPWYAVRAPLLMRAGRIGVGDASDEVIAAHMRAHGPTEAADAFDRWTRTRKVAWGIVILSAAAASIAMSSTVGSTDHEAIARSSQLYGSFFYIALGGLGMVASADLLRVPSVSRYNHDLAERFGIELRR